ncbi:E3 ubiquitin-protein ligase MGRN1 [Anabrus simplex]|uniref:E3 ubiquitin-protein ligase MGRN1 n=1 Tax=Anabrus simplex TaxID=316456 RepID=UPI0035A2F8E7
MGALASRQHAGVEEVDIVSNLAYKYPPRSGNYFGNHFIMGGERFDTPQPEAYLFGENADLNFLGSRPTPFPYPPPQANDPTKTLKSLINIRKESLRFVRSPDTLNKINEGHIEASKSTQFNIEFTFDCDVRCAITIYYFCTEDITANGIIYNPRDSSLNSETYHYKRGANQQFCQFSHAFDPSRYTDEELAYNPDRDIMPIVIHCVAEEGLEEPRQSHTTIAVVDHHSDGTYVLKALKQKLFVDGLCYLLQEIYGIENKNIDNNKGTSDEETEDNGAECVICMCDVRDTLILPCRHLCLCYSCADSLRYQANNCPICRAPFRALLQIRALQKSTNHPQPAILPPEGSCENIPAGYEAVSLLEALNGPCPTRMVPVGPPLDVAETPDQEVAVQAAEILNRPIMERTPSSLKSSSEDCDITRSPRDRGTGSGGTCSSPEFHTSVVLAREGETKTEHSESPLLIRHCGRLQNRDKNVSRPHDTVRLVNEKSCEQDENLDEDSEAEKLSPLLHPVANSTSEPLDLVVVNDLEDDEMDEDEELDLKVEVIAEEKKEVPVKSEGLGNNSGLTNDPEACLVTTTAAGDDSDYYTPEDPTTTILSPLHTEKALPSSAESTPGRWMGTPGTPLSATSHLSNRSSGDSYSSSSSTRQLLTLAGSRQDSSNSQDKRSLAMNAQVYLQQDGVNHRASDSTAVLGDSI